MLKNLIYKAVDFKCIQGGEKAEGEGVFVGEKGTSRIKEV